MVPVKAVFGWALLLAAFAPGAVPAAAPTDEARELVEKARAAFLDVKFDEAKANAEAALSLLEGEDATAPEVRRLLVEAWDVLVHARYGLGDEEGAREAIDRALALDPAFAVDPATAGPKLAELVASRRRDLIGTIEVECHPAPCTEVLVDGIAATPADPDRPGRFLVPAGRHTLTLRRRNFLDEQVEDVNVAAGQVQSVLGHLRQVARDVTFATVPAGARVLFDGREVGRTEGAADAGSRPFVITGVEPGRHVLVLEADCHERYEQRVDVAELIPDPLDLGTIRLTRARAVLELDWERPEGVLAVDGRPVQRGPVDVCPGSHEVSLTLGGRRVYVERVEVRNGQTVKLSPGPRPTVALVGEAARFREAIHDRGWNVLEPGASEELRRALGERMHRGDVPDFPRKLIDRDPALARLARKAAPEADLVAAWIDGRDMVRPTVWLALVVPDPGIIEATGWRPDDPAAETATLGVFAVSLPAQRTYLGFDLVERRFGPPVVAAVQPGGPAEAAGVAPGMVLTAIDGRPVGSAEDLARLRAVLAPGQRVALSFGLGREPKVVELKAERTLAAPNPARLHGLLAPALARARSQRLAGDPWQRVAGGLWAGMILARLGESEAAARVLDRTTIEPALDPPGDARGTVLFVLERLFRSLANQEYAEELRARRSLLEGARYGGRDGPPLRYADAESPPSR